MQATATATVTVTIDGLIPSFVLHLKAKNRSPRTVQSYSESARKFAAFATERRMPRDVKGSIRREHVEAFMVDLNDRFRPATAAVRFRSLQQFFKWAVEDGEIENSPMERMKAPTIPDEPPPVLTDAELRALLKACEGKDFASRRDLAITCLFADTGARLSEVAGLQIEDVDLDAGLARVVGKGASPDSSPSGRRPRRLSTATFGCDEGTATQRSGLARRAP